jgi:protein-tyrosine phosphatase
MGPSFPDKLFYKKLNIQETFDFNISSFFEEAFEFIESGLNSGGAVLVHCVQGQSRSPTIVTAYLMRRFHLSYQSSSKIVKKNHPSTDPNVGFIEQLKAYERGLQESASSMTCSACKCIIQ